MDNDGVTPPKGSKSLGPLINDLDFALCAMSLLFVCARVFTRLRVTKDLCVSFPKLC